MLEAGDAAGGGSERSWRREAWRLFSAPASLDGARCTARCHDGVGARFIRVLHDPISAVLFPSDLSTCPFCLVLLPRSSGLQS